MLMSQEVKPAAPLGKEKKQDIFVSQICSKAWIISLKSHPSQTTSEQKTNSIKDSVKIFKKQDALSPVVSLKANACSETII